MKEKKVPWMLLTGVLALFFVAALSVPIATAQSQDSRAQRLFYIFQYVFSFVQNNYVDPVDPEVLMEGALKGLFDSLGDPHSAYLTATDMRGLSDTTAGEFGGVGLYISKQAPAKGGDGRDSSTYVEVVAPIEDTPAYRAGIQSGDLIIKIEGDSTENLAIDEVVNRLRGPAGGTPPYCARRASGAFSIHQAPVGRQDAHPPPAQPAPRRLKPASRSRTARSQEQAARPANFRSTSRAPCRPGHWGCRGCS